MVDVILRVQKFYRSNPSYQEQLKERMRLYRLGEKAFRSLPLSEKRSIIAAGVRELWIKEYVTSRSGLVVR